MIVEDTEFNLIAVKNMLKLITNAEIVEAHNGKIAVDLFKQYNSKSCNCPNRAFKLILMDLQMPILDGYEASKVIIGLNTAPLNIVSLTSYTSKAVKNKAIRIGMK